jgi:hypothetical protein
MTRHRVGGEHTKGGAASFDSACSVCGSKMRHLVCVCLQEGRAGRGARDVVTTGGKSRQTVETIDKAQHIRHEYVGDGEPPQNRLAKYGIGARVGKKKRAARL